MTDLKALSYSGSEYNTLHQSSASIPYMFMLQSGRSACVATIDIDTNMHIRSNSPDVWNRAGKNPQSTKHEDCTVRE